MAAAAFAHVQRQLLAAYGPGPGVARSSVLAQQMSLRGALERGHLEQAWQSVEYPELQLRDLSALRGAARRTGRVHVCNPPLMAWFTLSDGPSLGVAWHRRLDTPLPDGAEGVALLLPLLPTLEGPGAGAASAGLPSAPPHTTPATEARVPGTLTLDGQALGAVLLRAASREARLVGLRLLGSAASQATRAQAERETELRTVTRGRGGRHG